VSFSRPFRPLHRREQFGGQVAPAPSPPPERCPATLSLFGKVAAAVAAQAPAAQPLPILWWAEHGNDVRLVAAHSGGGALLLLGPAFQADYGVTAFLRRATAIERDVLADCGGRIPEGLCEP